MTLNLIYKRNPLSFDLIPSKHLTDGNLTLVIPISLTLLSNACMLLFMWSTISLNSFIVTIYKSGDLLLFAILVFFCEVVAFDIVVTGALKGIASIPLLYCNLGNKYVTKLRTKDTV